MRALARGAAPWHTNGACLSLVGECVGETEDNMVETGTGEPRRFAVMLNDNAKKVTDEVRRTLAELVPPDDLFFSRTYEEAEQITETLVRRRYPVVFTGGGDGTVVDFVDRITRVAERMEGFECPHVGILRLGTGNALAEMVSSGKYDCDIRSYIENGFDELQRLGLIETEGRRFPFSGLGLDAEILNDFRAMKERFAEVPVLGKVAQTVGGYFLAYFGRTVPRNVSRFVRRKVAKVRVENLGERALRLGENAAVLKVYGPGETLFEGSAYIAMVGTAPYYGYGLKILPYAGLSPHYMQLRLSAVPKAKVLTQLPSVWRGEWSDAALYDFYATHIRISFSEDVPFQIGGDAEGWRKEVEYRLSPAFVNLVRFI